MEISTVLLVAAEALLASFIIWGILHEQKLIRMERRAAGRIARQLRAIKARRAARAHRRQNRTAVYRPVLPEKKDVRNRAA